jgi:thiamine-phosphate diphosphorylase
MVCPTGIRCYITDRHTLRGASLTDTISRNISAGVDWIQIREKDLPTKELLALLRSIEPHRSKILVNGRVDVALAAGAAGAHLPSHSPPPRLWRNIAPPGFLIGVSCHSAKELRMAEEEGADYAVFGPVFPPLSKPPDRAAHGLEGLARAVAVVRIPVLALGGITTENGASCIAAGAAGIAGISIFQRMNVRI